MNSKTGIAVVGSVLVDRLCEIGAYPNIGELTTIRNLSLSVGGLVPNDTIDLKKIAPDLPVFAYGKIGNDDLGQYVLDTLQKHGVRTDGIRIDDSEHTGFTDVMSVVGGQRTFFTYSGGNSFFGYDDIDWERMSARMLHLGYFLLLDKIDVGDGLRILQEAKSRGIQTSIDLVSEHSDRYSLVLPCLPYVDNLIVNELEACKLCGMDVSEEELPTVAEKLLRAGVRERVIIHTPKQAVCRNREELTVLQSYELPQGWIQGTTGAGDAFCSGALVGIYYGKSDAEILEYAQMAAVASLRSTDATGGLKELNELKEHTKTLSRI